MKYGVMPDVTPAEFVRQGADSVLAWARRTAPIAGSREKVYRAVRQAFQSHLKFGETVDRIYPQNQLEWLLITDAVADTLARELGRILERYSDANPDEILTEGRQRYELVSLGANPPGRVLGLHLPILSAYVLNKSDSLLATRQTQDRAGLEEGFLRGLQDWCRQWDQSHGTLLADYESRLEQEDWIINRLESTCGRTKWLLTEQYVAVVGVDSTVTPPREQFAHEFHLRSRDCDDERVILIDLPRFAELQDELAREYEAKQRAAQPPSQPAGGR